MRRRRNRYPTGVSIRWPPMVISGTGLIIVTLWFWHVRTFDYADVTSSGLSEDAVFGLKLIETALVVGLSAALLYGGYWFATSEFTTGQCWWGALWTMLGAIGIVAVVLLTIAHQLVEGLSLTPQIIVEELLLGAAGGSLAGLLIGVGTAETMKQTERVAKQRDTFEFLNKFLRHNILNGITVVHGTATTMAADVPGDLRLALRTIEDRSQSIAELTQDVRHVARALSGDAALEPVDLGEILRSAVETAGGRFDEAAFDADVPDDVTVRATRALEFVFDNLLANAVEHNEAETARVDVRVDSEKSTVSVSIADNGPGLPDDRKETIFEPNDRGDQGLGLYAVATLVSRFGGEVWVEDNEPSGAVFTVALPRHEAS